MLLAFFNIGPWEFAMLMVAGLILIGPRRLPEVMKQVGKGLNELRRASTDFQTTIEREVREEEFKERARQAPPIVIKPAHEAAPTSPAPSAADSTDGEP